MGNLEMINSGMRCIYGFKVKRVRLVEFGNVYPKKGSPFPAAPGTRLLALNDDFVGPYPPTYTKYLYSLSLFYSKEDLDTAVIGIRHKTWAANDKPSCEAIAEFGELYGIEPEFYWIQEDRDD